MLGRRCGVYAERPLSCRKFECLWLQSQSTQQKMQFELRPDRSHVVFAMDAVLTGADEIDPSERHLFIHVDPDFPDAWREPLPMLAINTFLSRGGIVKVIVGHEMITIRKRGRSIFERSDPFFGMLKRGDPLAGLPEPTNDIDELMKRRL